MRYWVEQFNSDKEDFTCIPIWIHLYSLPQEYWNEEILRDIGNTLGTYIKTAKATCQMRYTAYACICVYMNISKAIPESILLSYEDFEWLQTLDYEFSPFRFHKCHEHGCLYRDYPLIRTQNPSPTSPHPDQDGFTTVHKNKKTTPKKPAPDLHAKDSSNANPYVILKQLDLVQEETHH